LLCGRKEENQKKKQTQKKQHQNNKCKKKGKSEIMKIPNSWWLQFKFNGKDFPKEVKLI
jgi:hypothetical protein